MNLLLLQQQRQPLKRIDTDTRAEWQVYTLHGRTNCSANLFKSDI